MFTLSLIKFEYIALEFDTMIEQIRAKEEEVDKALQRYNELCIIISKETDRAIRMEIATEMVHLKEIIDEWNKNAANTKKEYQQLKFRYMENWQKMTMLLLTKQPDGTITREYNYNRYIKFITNPLVIAAIAIIIIQINIGSLRLENRYNLAVFAISVLTIIVSYIKLPKKEDVLCFYDRLDSSDIELQGNYVDNCQL